MSDSVKLVTTKPDIELAQELKADLVEAAKVWCEACTKAHKAGFAVQANFSPNYLGSYIVQSLVLIKQY